MNIKINSTSQKQLNIPEETRNKFPELIAMVEQSKSMNNEERQYWVDVLPIMSEEQIQNLRSILDNEKKELTAADEEYEKQVGSTIDKASIQFDEFKYLEKKRAIREAEAVAEAEEENSEEELLAALDKL